VVCSTFLWESHRTYFRATTKGKWKEDPALGLLDVSSSNWRAAVCMEDPTYRHPHAIIDVMTDTDVVSVDLSAGEVKAIMRTMKTRMGISYYRDHVTLPVRFTRALHSILLTDCIATDDIVLGSRLRKDYPRAS
jgi:hypothetical protein